MTRKIGPLYFTWFSVNYSTALKSGSQLIGILSWGTSLGLTVVKRYLITYLWICGMYSLNIFWPKITKNKIYAYFRFLLSRSNRTMLWGNKLAIQAKVVLIEKLVFRLSPPILSTLSFSLLFWLYCAVGSHEIFAKKYWFVLWLVELMRRALLSHSHFSCTSMAYGLLYPQV